MMMVQVEIMITDSRVVMVIPEIDEDVKLTMTITYLILITLSISVTRII